MLKRKRVLSLLTVALGALLGWAAATGKIAALLGADEKKPAAPAEAGPKEPVPGSPGATTTIDGRYLPNTPQLFKGEINFRPLDMCPSLSERFLALNG